MTFSYLNNDVVGKQVIPAVFQGYIGTNQDPSDGGKYYTTDPGGGGGLYGDLQDEISEQPNFNTPAAVYTPLQAYGTSVQVDNRNGLNPSATVTLSYTAETGATASTETSNSITAGVTESVSAGFPGIAETDTTFSISGTFSYTDGTSTSTSSSVTNSVEVPVTVPAGKIYEATIYYIQEILTVPYTLQVFVPDYTQQGSNSYAMLSTATFAEPISGIPGFSDTPSDLFGQVQQYNAAGQDSDLYSAGTAPNLTAPDNTAGAVTLDGTATMYNYGAATTQVYDITDQTGSGVASESTGAGALRVLGDSGDASAASNSDRTGSPAAVDEGAGVGVHRKLGDGGESFRASRFNDWVEGGAGGDGIYLDDGGDDRAEGKGGDDLIQALGGGRNRLDGGEGNDHLAVVSDRAFNDLRGGAGDDLIEAYAPRSIVSGGQGDDTFVLDARSAGSVIVGAEGRDKLELSPAGRVVLERSRSGDDLFLHTDGDASSYDRTTDIVWLGFFKGDGQVNGLSAADLAATFDAGSRPVYSPDTGAWSAVPSTVSVVDNAVIRFIDGGFGSDVVLVYQAALGRAPDAGGLQYWTDQLEHGASLEDLARGFIQSPEFAAKYGQLGDGDYVTALYQNALGRAPDAAGAQFWSDRLGGGAPREAVLAGFAMSPENKSNVVAQDGQAVFRLYTTALGRAPDAAGLRFWTGGLTSGQSTLQQEAESFVAGPEFTGKYGSLSNQQFVDALYQNVLGRAGEASGESYWSGLLDAGAADRSDVVLGFSESQEYKTQIAPLIDASGFRFA